MGEVDRPCVAVAHAVIRVKWEHIMYSNISTLFATESHIGCSAIENGAI